MDQFNRFKMDVNLNNSRMPDFTVSQFYVKAIVSLRKLNIVLITIRSVKLIQWKPASIQRLSCVLLSLYIYNEQNTT